MPYSFPDVPDDVSCSMVLVPIHLVPIVGALFSQLEKRKRWSTDADWQLGYRAFVELQDQLVNNCVETIVQEIRAFRGIKPAYVAVEEEDRTIDMYNDVNDIIANLVSLLVAMRGPDAIGDNIILALRGIVEADETRNIADLLT
jgi:hypothetical protein